MSYTEPPPDLPLPDEPPPEADAPQPALPGFEPPPEPPDTWAWLDAQFVGLEQRDADGAVAAYVVGCADLYADTLSGDLSGAFLPVQTFASDERERAEALLDKLEGYAEERDLAAHALPALAERAAAKIAAREGLDAPQWRALTPDEYATFEHTWDSDPRAGEDIPPQSAQQTLLHTAYELGGVEAEMHQPPPYPAAQALEEIGLSAEGFDPDRDPPPFYDAATHTAYWIGVYQPDPDERDVCVASILSLTRNPQNGAYAAQLAPCVVGDWDKAYAASEHLIGVAERSDDIARVFEAAEGMAIAADQRAAWQHARGVELAPESAHEIGEYAAQQWELEL